MNLARSSALLADLFSPLTVVASELRGPADPAMLLPEEAAACETFRSNRLEEFAAGRLCARHSLGEFGLGAFAVRRNADRSPHWPDGFVGSITHTIGYCGAVVGTRERLAGVGIDAEITARVTRDVWTQALTRDDVAHLSGLSATDRERAAAAIFSAKESFYKCQSGVTGCWLDYQDVDVELVYETRDSGTFLIRPATEAALQLLANFVACGRYRFTEALVVTGIALTLDDARVFTPPRLRIAS